MSDLKVGDLVKLKSGSPLMTLIKIDGDICSCRWFDCHDNQKSRQENFPEISLKKETERAPVLRSINED